MKSTNRRCSHCRKKVPAESAIIGGLRAFCSMEHLIEFTKSESGQKQITKQIRKEHREERIKVKRRGDYLREAQAAFNAYIRLRDYQDPCICCDRHHQGQYHAGHYISVGSRPNLRFDEMNVHKQSAPCNNHLSGNQAEYRKRLIKKIGEAEVLRLESDHEPKHYTIDDLKEIKAKYTAMAKELKKKYEIL
jgi:hypothetical protein